jgi:hypothetical protein
MKTIDFTKPGGFPLTQDQLNYLQSAYIEAINALAAMGGGGTSPSCVSQYLKDKGIKPECVIMLTDGYVGSDWGTDWEVPVLWVVVGGNNTVAPNGKTIHIKGD